MTSSTLFSDSTNFSSIVVLMPSIFTSPTDSLSLTCRLLYPFDSSHCATIQLILTAHSNMLYLLPRHLSASLCYIMLFRQRRDVCVFKTAQVRQQIPSGFWGKKIMLKQTEKWVGEEIELRAYACYNSLLKWQYEVNSKGFVC